MSGHKQRSSEFEFKMCVGAAAAAVCVRLRTQIVRSFDNKQGTQMCFFYSFFIIIITMKPELKQNPSDLEFAELKSVSQLVKVRWDDKERPKSCKCEWF